MQSYQRTGKLSTMEIGGQPWNFGGTVFPARPSGTSSTCPRPFPGPTQLWTLKLSDNRYVAKKKNTSWALQIEVELCNVFCWFLFKLRLFPANYSPRQNTGVLAGFFITGLMFSVGSCINGDYSLQIYSPRQNTGVLAVFFFVTGLMFFVAWCICFLCDGA
jgi:hypothetical protein